MTPGRCGLRACSEAGDSFGRVAGGSAPFLPETAWSGFATRRIHGGCSEAGDSFGRVRGGSAPVPSETAWSGFATTASLRRLRYGGEQAENHAGGETHGVAE